jgi:hypothetical protein
LPHPIQTPGNARLNAIGNFPQSVIVRQLRIGKSSASLKTHLIFRGNDPSPNANAATTTSFQTSRDASDGDRGDKAADKSY